MWSGAQGPAGGGCTPPPLAVLLLHVKRHYYKQIFRESGTKLGMQALVKPTTQRWFMIMYYDVSTVDKAMPHHRSLNDRHEIKALRWERENQTEPSE